jgi:putative endonuclease
MPGLQKMNEPETSFFCYLLECSDGTFYCGWTKDLNRRLAVHNAGRGARYTRIRRPVRLAYFEACESQAQAMLRERQIKARTHAEKLALSQQSEE